MSKNKQPMNYLDMLDIEAKNDNNSAYLYYLNLLIELAVNSITWQGLPTEIDARYMAMTISERGHALFFRDESLEYNKQFVCLPCTITGRYNIYGVPLRREAYAVNGYRWVGDENNSVIIWNNRLRHSDLPVIRYYARKLADCERSIEVNVRGQKTPRILACEKDNVLSIENAMKKYDGNTPVIVVSKNLINAGADTPLLYDLTVPYKAGDLNIYKRQLLGDALSYFGILNLQSEKKERQITDEITSSMGYIEARRYARMNTLLQAAEQINNMFGLNMQPRFNNYVLSDMLINAEMEVGADEQIYNDDNADM